MGPDARGDRTGQECRGVRRPGRRADGEVSGRRWLSEPKAAVWIALAAAVVDRRRPEAAPPGGRLARRWLRLGEPNVTPEEIEAVAEHGRAGVWELLRIFSSSPVGTAAPGRRRALARLWLLDQLVAEEEQAVVRRGYTVTWSARRRYPRALRTRDPDRGDLRRCRFSRTAAAASDRRTWNGRIACWVRAARPSRSSRPGPPGRGRVAFTIFPGDFETNGPHRLVLQTRVRTAGLTDSWEIEPPHIPFNFEFDPILQARRDPDSARSRPATSRSRGPSGSSRTVAGDGEPRLISRSATSGPCAIRPGLRWTTPLPCDLAHAISIEFEGLAGRFAGGRLIVSGQGLPRPTRRARDAVIRRFELGPIPPLPPGVIERPGPRRMRIWLEADPDSGWADPDIRSIWPGRTQTNWVEVEIVRR